MKHRAVIKQSGDWWIGWLVHLPGVNAQGRTRGRAIESLRIGARDMLETQLPSELSEWGRKLAILAIGQKPPSKMPTWRCGRRGLSTIQCPAICLGVVC